jgi:hypothetical protein
MEFIEAPAFTRYLSEYLDDDEYGELQGRLAANPDAGDLMPQTGGFRKLRWKDPRRGKGRRGGLRIIYFHFAADQVIWLLTLYGKDEAADLTPTEKKALQRALDAELLVRRARQLARKENGKRTRQ